MDDDTLDAIDASDFWLDDTALDAGCDNTEYITNT